MKNIIPRGSKVSLPNGSLPEVVSPYLIDLINKTGGAKGPIGKQFVADKEREIKYFDQNLIDPYFEKKYEVAPGLIYKFKGRALWIIGSHCPSYCRFCMRGRIAGNSKLKNYLTDLEISEIYNYLLNHKEINEIILSGGEPLLTTKSYLSKIIDVLVKLQKKEIIKIIRIDTRLPIINPSSIKPWHYEFLGKLYNPYFLVHINHPYELTKESINVLNNFRVKSNGIILGHSVFLKGINDSVETLCELFNKMTIEGIRPYYLYQNDPVPWAKHFTVPIKDAIKLWQKVRPRLSGIAATARFIIESSESYGKIVIPEGGAWDVDYSHFYDFKGEKHSLL